MIVTADWVLPVTGPPIRQGAILVRRNRIRELGALDEIRAHSRDEVHSLDGCIIAPGLVNAHTHLALTALAGVPDERRMVPWLKQVVTAVRALDADDLAASVAYGAVRCLESGTTCVGDIAFGPESLSAAADAGLGGVFFWEVLGIGPSELPETLAEREFPGADGGAGRARSGLSPHSLYTSGPRLLRAVHSLARAAGSPFAVHLAESAAETELLLTGAGPLEPVAMRQALGFKPPRKSPVGYADSLGILDGAIAVHCVRVDGRDAGYLAARAAGVVLCPRSNAHLDNGVPPVATLLEAGCRIALGTDSLASNEDLDLFAEARVLRDVAPSLTAQRTLEIMTVEGARVLGVDGRFGNLAPERSADFVAVTAPPTDDPVRTLLEVGGRGTVRAVMAEGIWRVLDGRPTPDLRQAERGAERVAARARAALAGPR